LYHSGKGVPKDFVEMAKWYRKAADQGYNIAQGFLGTAYKHGWGVPQDYVQAYLWFQLAAAHGWPASDRDIVAAKMTPAQIAEAKKAAAEWRPAASAGMPGTAVADDIDAWCAQVKKASSIVTCSDPELRQGAIARNKLFEAARTRLSLDAYKALTEDQQRWIRAYTARCGVSLDDPLPALPIAKPVIDCYRRESQARTAYLASRLAEPTAVSRPEAVPAPAPQPSTNDVVKDLLVGAGIPRAEVEAQAAWDGCTEAAVDHFADQPEPARTVAEAAMAACVAEEGKYMIATGIRYPASIEEATMPKLLARVMAIRAARAKLRQENPQAKPAIDYGRM
jgi:hypothetical protein